MADEGTKDEKAAAKADHEPPAGAETTATLDGGGRVDRLHREREVDRPAQEGEAGGGDLLRLLRRATGWRPSGDVRLQRRPGRVVGVPAHGRRRAAAGGVPGGRNAAADAASARPERGVVARLHRPRVRRSGGHRLQPRHRGRQQGRRGQQEEAERRRRRREGVLRLQARSRVAVRVHGPVAFRPRPVGLCRCSSPARATAATGSAGSCACCRRRRASGSTAPS